MSGASLWGIAMRQDWPRQPFDVHAMPATAIATAKLVVIGWTGGSLITGGHGVLGRVGSTAQLLGQQVCQIRRRRRDAQTAWPKDFKCIADTGRARGAARRAPLHSKAQPGHPTWNATMASPGPQKMTAPEMISSNKAYEQEPN
jgi:hypothetical protein